MKDEFKKRFSTLPFGLISGTATSASSATFLAVLFVLMGKTLVCRGGYLEET